MRTEDLIQRLSSDLTPWPKRRWGLSSFLAWLGASALVVGLTLRVLPLRPDLALRWISPAFRWESALCGIVFVLALWVAYRSSIPGLLRRGDRRVALALYVAFALALLSHFSPTGFRAELLGELNFYRGRCGPIILMVGGLEAAFLVALARRAAPTEPRLTGGWIALASGATGLVVIQLICDHENFVHILLWHLAPVVVLTGLGVWLGTRLLRW